MDSRYADVVNARDSHMLVRVGCEADDWAVIRRWRAEVEKTTPIVTELVVFTGSSFEEAAARAEAMEKYLRSGHTRPPPTWPS